VKNVAGPSSTQSRGQRACQLRQPPPPPLFALAPKELRACSRCYNTLLTPKNLLTLDNLHNHVFINNQGGIGVERRCSQRALRIMESWYFFFYIPCSLTYSISPHIYLYNSHLPSNCIAGVSHPISWSLSPCPCRVLSRLTPVRYSHFHSFALVLSVSKVLAFTPAPVPASGL
jgi:hypothetical protein